MFPWINDSLWFATGVIATLAVAYIAHRIGRIQIRFMREAHDLNLKLATCQIGSGCTISLKPYIANRPDVLRYEIVTSIYNAGDLAAKDLKGNWNLSCSESGCNCSRPVWIDFVSKAFRHDLEPYVFSSNELTQSISNGKFRINVDIHLEFFGLDENERQQYRARYEYSHEHKQMIKI